MSLWPTVLLLALLCGVKAAQGSCFKPPSNAFLSCEPCVAVCEPGFRYPLPHESMAVSCPPGNDTFVSPFECRREFCSFTSCSCNAGALDTVSITCQGAWTPVGPSVLSLPAAPVGVEDLTILVTTFWGDPFAGLESYPNLTSLVLQDTNLHALISLPAGIELPRLTTLDLSNNAINNVSATFFAHPGFAMLEELTLGGNPLSDIPPGLFAPLTKVCFVRVDGTPSPNGCLSRSCFA